MGFAVRVRSAGQKYGPTCHQRDRADVTEFVTLVRLSSLGQHVGVLARWQFTMIQGSSSTPQKSPTKRSSTKKREKKEAPKTKIGRISMPPSPQVARQPPAHIMCYGCGKALRPNSDDLSPPPFNAVVCTNEYRTYLPKQKHRQPGHDSEKDRLSLLLEVHLYTGQRSRVWSFQLTITETDKSRFTQDHKRDFASELGLYLEWCNYGEFDASPVQIHLQRVFCGQKKKNRLCEMGTLNTLRRNLSRHEHVRRIKSKCIVATKFARFIAGCEILFFIVI